MTGDLLVQYALRFVGLPYRWGGDDSIDGFDCSGFALEILAAFGFNLPDQTAAGLYIWCKTMGARPETRPGALAFYGKQGKISHVGVVINKDLMVEAGGGGAAVTSKDLAASLNAFVRIRPIRYRQDLVGCYYPMYSVARVVV